MKLSFETVLRARQGDITAQEAVVTANLPSLHRLASGYCTVGIEKDDLVQEGLIGLFSAVNHYNSDGGASFSTYAYRCMSNSMQSAVKKATGKKHMPLNTALSLSGHEVAVSTEQIAIYNEQYRLLQERIIAELTKLEQRVLFAYLDGVDYGSIAKHCNITTKSVDNALYRVRKKLLSVDLGK